MELQHEGVVVVEFCGTDPLVALVSVPLVSDVVLALVLAVVNGVQ